MGKGKFWGLFFALSSSLILAATPVIAAEKVYINGIDAKFPPFAYVDKAGKPDGFDVKSLDWIAKEMGFEVKHQPVDWEGIVPSLKSRKIDIVASGMSITDERKREVSFSIPYWKTRQILIAGKEARVTVEQALSDGNKIGVQRGTAEANWIKVNLIGKAGKRLELVQYDSPMLAIEDVINGRITAAAMNDAPALDAAGTKPVKILGEFGMTEEMFGYAVRKEDTELLKKVNEGLRRLMKSPYWTELKKIYIEK
ncbi:MAG TPA: ABC transporter substrate-binding protein [Syntrophorhabdaceae bacterium]|jgi:polar amino acid transport system substrate-binding protein